MKKMTHTGMEKGRGYNTGMKSLIKLRETKNYWITEFGRKYSKTTGRWIGENLLLCLILVQLRN
jgi:hypothetical protein